jgi:hypothetical protein
VRGDEGCSLARFLGLLGIRYLQNPCCGPLMGDWACWSLGRCSYSVLLRLPGSCGSIVACRSVWLGRQARSPRLLQPVEVLCQHAAAPFAQFLRGSAFGKLHRFARAHPLPVRIFRVPCAAALDQVLDHGPAQPAPQSRPVRFGRALRPALVEQLFEQVAVPCGLDA